MQESRLFKIVYYLLEKGQATAHELAEKFEVCLLYTSPSPRDM